jgi:transposase
VILTFRYRLLPHKSQHRALERLCASQSELYNAALEERIDYYRKTTQTRTYIDQFKALTQCRRELADMGELPVNAQRWTLKRVDDAFQGFFRRVMGTHACPSCGLVIDRDYNASLNILRAGIGAGALNVIGSR